MKFSAKSIRVGMIAGLLLLGTYGNVYAQTGAQGVSAGTGDKAPSSLANQVAHDRALNEEAARLAQARGISPQKAAADLKIDEAVTDPVAQLRTIYSDRLAGIYVEHDPVPRIVVRLKGAASEATRSLNTSAGVIPVEFMVGAAHTQAELHQIIAAKLPALKAALPGLQGTATDDRTGDVVLYLLGDDAKAAEAQRVASTILGVPTRVRALPVPVTQQVRGSGSINSPAGSCTGAFVVQKTDGSATGLLSAGHCPQRQCEL